MKIMGYREKVRWLFKKSFRSLKIPNDFKFPRFNRKPPMTRKLIILRP